MANPTTAAGAEGHEAAADVGAVQTPAQEQAADDSTKYFARSQSTQDAEAAESSESQDSAQAAREQAKKDAKARQENPNKPVVRGPAKGVGGESFSYGQKTKDSLDI